MMRAFFTDGGQRPRLTVAALAFVTLTGFYVAIGAFAPAQLPRYASSPQQIIGMVLMMIVTTSYLLAAWSVSQKRSLALLDELRPLIPHRDMGDECESEIRGGLGRGWKIGSVIGILLGLLNTNPIDALNSSVPLLQGGISMGQIVLWWVIGLVLVVRFSTSRAFRRLGALIEIDLFRMDPLKPLARAGTVDVLLVAGALLFTPLQSLDAEFRWENYRFALAIAAPAMIFFMIWPLWPVHRRLVSQRAGRVAEVESELERPIPAEVRTESASPEELAQRELLLAHRDRLREARTWPVDLQLVSRVLLYFVFPPLAWAGAALVERMIDRAIAGAG